MDIGQPYLVDVMNARQKRQWSLLMLIWCVAFIGFWVWWLQPEHIQDWWRAGANSMALIYITAMPGLYFLFVWQMKRSNPHLPIPPSLRVAMVTTKTPSEPFSVVRNTLVGMLSQQFPHDVWLADEEPQPETIQWCAANGVFISSRKGVDEYHQPTWPRRERSKEGNLAYFYDHFGYENYDVVVQLDADHKPEPGYLEALIRPFADPDVGYVSAPSICDANANDSWAVRGRLHIEAGWHGALQAGHSNGWAPLCIGSHYAVRTSALREIGGLGPELAEDHSTTLLMNAGGWNGVHAFDAEAHGDGPASFVDCMTQEFQWSRSLMVILLTLTPGCFSRLSPHKKLQFLFVQFWYPITSFIMLFGFLLPLIALITRTPWMNLSYINFLAASILFSFCTLLPVIWIKRNGWMRPQNSKIISWEMILFQIVKWPWVFIGCVAAVYDVFSRKPFQFRVTPKGVGDNVRPLPVGVLIPYLVLVAVSAGVAIFQKDAGTARGYYYFAVLNTAVISIAVLVVVLRHAYENKSRRGLQNLALWQKQLAFGFFGIFLATNAFILRSSPAINGITWGYQQEFQKIAFVAAQLGIGSNGAPDAVQSAPIAKTVESASPLDTSTMSVNLGIYDPGDVFAESDMFAIAHEFVDGTTYESGELASFFADAGARNRWHMVTVEPWGLAGRDPALLLKDVASGMYDENFTTLCNDLSSAKTPVFVRWGHEMENVSDRYPWAQSQAGDYVIAYQRFVEICRAATDNAYYVWSPVGHSNLARYWPGDEFVDLVGLSVYGFPEYELGTIGTEQTFDEIFGPRYELVKGFEHGVIIAEMGVNGGEPYETEWLNNALAATSNYPLLRTVVFFNAWDTEGVWGTAIETPDWRLRSDLFDYSQFRPVAYQKGIAGRP